MRSLAALILLALAACAPAAPSRPQPTPRFDGVLGAACVREDLRRHFAALGEAVEAVTPDEEQQAVDGALDRCGYPQGYERRTERAASLLAASSIRSAAARPYREHRLTEATRRNAERAAQREQDIREAGRRYLICVLAAAGSLARGSSEAAPVIAEAATGSCPVEAGMLHRLDPGMKEAIDRQARAAVLAHVLRVRGGQDSP